MDVAIHADEDFLNEILRLLAVPNRAVDEVQQPGLVTLDQFLKRTLFTGEERRDDARVIFGSEPFSYGRSRKGRPLECDLSHVTMPPWSCTRARSDKSESIWAPPCDVMMRVEIVPPYEKQTTCLIRRCRRTSVKDHLIKYLARCSSTSSERCRSGSVHVWRRFDWTRRQS